MKKLLLLILFISCTFSLYSCNNSQNNESDDITQSGSTQINWNYLGSEYKWNYVWWWAMNLAWTELSENIIHEKLIPDTNDSTILEMIYKLNNPVFTKSDLDEKSYYVKSWYGQSTVNTINKETKEKFPTKSFGDLQMSLSPTDIISYAYFLKEVEYKTIFEKKDVKFNYEDVKWFFAKSEKQRENIKIIKYENDDKFIISLQLIDEKDQLILAKGYDMNNPESITKEIKQVNLNSYFYIWKNDIFQAPKLILDYHRDYNELIGIQLANKDFKGYTLSQMFENIKFDMDEKGARVENEGVIVIAKSMKIIKEKPKNFILDKPYWVIMKRTDSKNPYFLLGIKNTELMEKN